MKIRFAGPSLPRGGALVVFVAEGEGLTGLAAKADERCKGQLGRAVEAAGFTGKRDSYLDVVAPGGGLDRILIFGLGKPENLRPLDIEMLGGAIAGTLQSLKARSAALAIDLPVKSIAGPDQAALMASGARLRVYSFTHYKSKKPENAGLSELTLHCVSHAAAQRHFLALDAVAEGVHLARDLVNEPPNILSPVEFATRIKSLTKHGVKVEILTPAQMRKLGMGALLGVAQGSVREPRLVIMRWDGGAKGSKPLAFIGKGVTFDTGGISIKPAAGM
ncbi:MAG: leucyl aminopeptidase, partial [Alphaproteobacteria bacterium]|nr:leucyl aminopeptidase [Alphaproteobacteria bacterium]